MFTRAYFGQLKHDANAFQEKIHLSADERKR